MEFEIELAAPFRQPRVPEPGADLLVVVVHTPEVGARQRGERLQLTVTLEHLGGRPPRSVAVADREKSLRVELFAPEVAPGAGEGNRAQPAVVTHIGVVEPVRQNLRAVQPLPPEEVVGKWIRLGPVHLVSEERVDAGQRQQLRKRRTEPEAIREPAHRRSLAEGRSKVPLAVEKLAADRLPAGHVEVGLYPHAPNRLPAPLIDSMADLLEELGVVLLEEGVELGRGLVEGQLRILLQQPGHGVEGPPGLAASLLQGPQPRQIEMGVAAHVHGSTRRMELAAAWRGPDPGARPRDESRRVRRSSSPGGCSSMPSGSSQICCMNSAGAVRDR